MMDSRLRLNDLKVYAVMAMSCRANNISNVGQRLLAEESGCDRRTVRRSLDQLAKCGHLARCINTLGKRTAYQLNSTVFTNDL